MEDIVYKAQKEGYTKGKPHCLPTPQGDHT